MCYEKAQFGKKQTISSGSLKCKDAPPCHPTHPHTQQKHVYRYFFFFCESQPPRPPPPSLRLLRRGRGGWPESSAMQPSLRASRGAPRRPSRAASICPRRPHSTTQPGAPRRSRDWGSDGMRCPRLCRRCPGPPGGCARLSGGVPRGGRGCSQCSGSRGRSGRRRQLQHLLLKKGELCIHGCGCSGRSTNTSSSSTAPRSANCRSRLGRLL